MKKFVGVLVVLLSITMAACNADSKSNKSAAIAEQTPQAGGYSNINNAKLKELLAKGITVVDIRRKEEWQQTGIVKGSKTITFFDHLGRINPNFVPEFSAIAKPDQEVILICRTGARTSAASKAIAQQLGYSKVLNVTHGITGWIAEKRPVVKY